MINTAIPEEIEIGALENNFRRNCENVEAIAAIYGCKKILNHDEVDVFSTQTVAHIGMFSSQRYSEKPKTNIEELSVDFKK